MTEPSTGEHGWYGGVEAGGTRFRCLIARGPDEVHDIVEIQTRDPTHTLGEVVRFFVSRIEEGLTLRALGVGTFGPVELNPEASAFGHITTTPKAGWQDVDIHGVLAHELGCPVALDTDVNAAVRGESLWGAGRGLAHVLYATIGTGIGVVAIVDGRVMRGTHHPEMGHMLVPVSPAEPDGFSGVCPFHGTCIEGLASGTAVVKRWKHRLADLDVGHPAWTLEVEYLASFLANLTLVFQPERIITGGGVMNDRLLSLIRGALDERLAGYRASLAGPDALARYVVMPELGVRAGVLGAVALARSTSR